MSIVNYMIICYGIAILLVTQINNKNNLPMDRDGAIYIATAPVMIPATIIGVTYGAITGDGLKSKRKINE